jgi:hypothetical protein
MGAISEAIKKSNRLKKMRLGQEAPTFVNLRGENRIALVPLIEAEEEMAWVEASHLGAEDNTYGQQGMDKRFRSSTLFYAMRNPDNLKERVFDSLEELLETLNSDEINGLAEEYQMMMEFSSPKLDGVSEEELVELKKVLEMIDWNVLSGRPWWYLRNFLSSLTRTQLQDSSFGLSLIKSLTGTSESEEPTPTADQS